MSTDTTFTIKDLNELIGTLEKITKQDILDSLKENNKELAGKKSVDDLIAEIKRLKRDVKIAAWAIGLTITIASGLLGIIMSIK